jgi:tetratricopeptide (TPR) repeat protein
MGISVAWGELIRGQNEKALQQVRKFYDLEPNHPLTQWVLAQVLNEMGRHDEAISICEKWLQNDPNNLLAIRDAGVAYAKAGRRDKAEEMISRYRELAKTQWIPVGRIAAIYGALGENDKAFAELDKALQERDWDMHRLDIEAYMRPLRSDPRFADFVKRINLPK